METSRKPQTYATPSLTCSISPAVEMTSISKPALNFHGHFVLVHWGSQHCSTAGVKKPDPETIKTNRSLWINSNGSWIWPWFKLKCCGALGIETRLNVIGFCYLQKICVAGSVHFQALSLPKQRTFWKRPKWNSLIRKHDGKVSSHIACVTLTPGVFIWAEGRREKKTGVLIYEEYIPLHIRLSSFAGAGYPDFTDLCISYTAEKLQTF